MAITTKNKLLDKTTLYPLIIFLIGCTISGCFYFLAVEKEQLIVHDKYMQRAEVHAKDIEASFNRSFVQVSSVANLFSSSNWVSFSEFSEFVTRVFPSFPAGRRVTALHRFPEEELKGYVNKIKKNQEIMFNGFHVFDYEPPNELSSPTSVNKHFSVISYTYPQINAQHFYGRNIRVNSPIGPLIYPVINNQEPTISDFSPPIEGVRDEPFILYVYPIIQKKVTDETQVNNVAGLILSSQYISDLFNHNVIKNEAQYFNYILIDKNNNQYHYPSKKLIKSLNTNASTENIQFTFPIELVHNNFTLMLIPKGPLNISSSILLFELLVAGILLTLALTFIAKFLLSQQQYLTSEINKTTFKLANQKKQLTIQNHQLEFALQEAKTSANAKSEFLANMSHEIRTPLNGVIGLTDLLIKTQLDSTQRDYINKLSFSGKHLLTVINDILDFSKIESGNVHLETVPFSIYSVVDNLKFTFDELAKEKGIEFNVLLDESCRPDLMGDVFRLNQVLINLCANAIKFTENGSVSVNVSMINDNQLSELYTVNFNVTDTGIGLAESAMNNLFTKFSQADSSTTRKYGGSGLGLTISQKLCHAMGGDISVESELHEGSSFTASVKLLLNNKVIIENKPFRQVAEKVDVLVVDDNPIALKILAKHLSEIGIKPIISQTAAEGLLALESDLYDIKIIISDWTMPIMDGNSFIKKVVELRKTNLPKIIIISAYDSAAIESYKKYLPICWVLEKPCATNILYQAIDDCLSGTHVIKQEFIPPKKLLGINFLVVEDNKINQLVINKVLTAEGAVVTIANHGKEAIALINQPNEFQIILMDIHMPEMDGIEATKIIRDHQLSSIATIPIIALTANVLENDVAAYLEIGMNAHIAKPINIDTLLNKIFPFLE